MSIKLAKRIVINSPQSSVSYTIPSIYDDLLIKISARSTSSTSSATRINMQYNNIATNYLYRLFNLSASTGTSSVSTSFYLHAGNMTNASYSSGFFGAAEVFIPTLKQDTLRESATVLSNGISPNNSTTTNTFSFAGSTQTSAYVDKAMITFTPELGNFDVGTTFSIYGIQRYTSINASSFKATGGDLTYINGYYYHFFYQNTDFIPNQNINGLQYVIVGGGGGGDFGNDNGRKGGNGGQVQSGTTNVTANTTYPIVVGAGGYAWTSQPANPGNPSSAFGITATGGLAEQNGSGNGANGTLVSNFTLFGENGYFGGQGATGSPTNGTLYTGGLGGGGRGSGGGNVHPDNGWSFTGGGGGGGNDAGNAAGSGGTGVVIFRYT